MMFRRSFVDLVLVLADQDLRLYIDFYLSTFALLLTGAMRIDQALYAYRIHGRNKHSNGAVLGGAYNTASQPWDPIAKSILQQILNVLKSRTADILLAFGSERYELAETLVREVLSPPVTPPPPFWRRSLVALLPKRHNPVEERS
jgi:hypothetical protein